MAEPLPVEDHAVFMDLAEEVEVREGVFRERNGDRPEQGRQDLSVVQTQDLGSHGSMIRHFEQRGKVFLVTNQNLLTRGRKPARREPGSRLRRDTQIKPTHLILTVAAKPPAAKKKT